MIHKCLISHTVKTVILVNSKIGFLEEGHLISMTRFC